MRRRLRKPYLVGTTAVVIVMMAAGLGDAAPADSTWTGEVKQWADQPRAEIPEDRYAMAGGCYTLSTQRGYVVPAGEGFTATASPAAAEPFHFQATELGRYLLFGTSAETPFVAASEGALGEAAYTVTRSDQGATAGGVALEQTDAAADAVARSEANEAAGRGAAVVADADPSELGDWKVEEAGAPGSFTFALPAVGRSLVVAEDGTLALSDTAADAFSLKLAEGCRAFPEVEVNVDGPILGGQTGFAEVRGFMDLHLHMMAFEFLGGRARCGRPWHRFGVTKALVDCPDHKPGGYGALLEQVLTKKNPGTPHDTDGWPTFAGWPTWNSLTHEQVYYRWLERAWRGGLRMFTNLLVDNNQLCKIYPFKRNSCNEMDGVRLQHERILQLQNYIDAQSGGPGEGWFRIVDDPFEAREVINQGKLAVVLGIEVSVPLDCGETLGTPRCDENEIPRMLDEVYAMGVRQMELVNKFDNAFSGVAGDSGDTGVIVNNGNFLETGHYWKMETCNEPDGHEHTHGHAHDKTQHNFHDFTGAPDEFSGRDALAGAVFAQAGVTGAAPVYPEGPHCNIMGLSSLGKTMIREMVSNGMIFDPDHMSAKAQDEALDYLKSEEIQALPGDPAVVSSHGWSNETIYPRIYELGGVITPYAGGSAGFVEQWRQHREWMDERYYFGFGYGADTNGFGTQGGPRDPALAPPVTYPFSGFGGVTVGQQKSGEKTYDINSDGVAHYGLYPDWIEDLRQQAGDQIVEDMTRGPEAYLQMWERAIGIAPNACRSDVEDLSPSRFAALKKGMSPEDVLRILGQPGSRSGLEFTYCVAGGRVATLTFSEAGALESWKVRKPR